MHLLRTIRQVEPLENLLKTVSQLFPLYLTKARPNISKRVDGQDTINSLPYARSFAQYFLGTQEKIGKMYPWLHQQAIEEGFRNLTEMSGPTTSCQFMSLTRSTFVGGQKFCSYLWSGDTSSRFDVLAQQITAGVSVAASGISSWTLDIGGFSGLNVDTDEGKELFVRWLSMGVFLPYVSAPCCKLVES